MKIRHSEHYAPLRRREYPAVGEQLDAILKLAQALQKQGIDLPEETCVWIAQCQAVKDRYTKKASIRKPA